MIEWFICINEKISGPYSFEETKEGIQTGRIPQNAQVWGRNLPEWLMASEWLDQLPALQKEFESLELARQKKVWHFAVGRNKYGPFERAELIHNLKNRSDVESVKVWTKGMEQWASLFDFHDLLEELGIEKRSSPRAPLIGSLTVRTEDGRVLIGQMRSISTGGFGAIQLGDNLSPGEKVSLEIRSKFLEDILVGKATVQYISDEGFIGFKFQNLSAEGQARIMQYIKGSKKSNTPLAA